MKGVEALHQPPPPSVVAALIRAGVSEETALAMECWKAEEVLALLQVHERTAGPRAGFGRAAPC